MNRRRAALPASLLALCCLLPIATSSRATEIWSGRTYPFARPDGVDWTLPQYQDRITPLVWITRKSSQGIFNIHQEPGYLGDSPAGTEWATGDAVNHASLTFAPWVTWAGNNPPTTIGVDAVVHLIAEDIYVDIRFTGWTGAAGGGGFSYVRGVSAPVPAAPTTWGRIKSLFR